MWRERKQVADIAEWCRQQAEASNNVKENHGKEK